VGVAEGARWAALQWCLAHRAAPGWRPGVCALRHPDEWELPDVVLKAQAHGLAGRHRWHGEVGGTREVGKPVVPNNRGDSLQAWLWIFVADSRTLYYYTDNGVITAIQQ
jgi:hypothetical protein